MSESPPATPPQMWIESASGRMHYPSPRQAAEVARGLGEASGDLVALVVGGTAVMGMADRAGRFILEYGQATGGLPYQALSVSRDDVVDAFERFAVGDDTRSPRLRWSRVDPRIASLASGMQRLPEAFYEIAPRLRAGDRPLDIRNEIMAETGLSKLAATKRVEEVQKLLKLARAALGGGLLFSGWLAFNLLINGWAIFGTLVPGLLALGQFGFAWYIFRESRPR